MPRYDIFFYNMDSPSGNAEELVSNSPEGGGIAPEIPPTSRRGNVLQKDEQALQQRKAKAVASGLIIANATMSIATNIISTGSSFEGNALYEERVNYNLSLINKSVNAVAGVGAALLLGGPIFGGVAAVATGVVAVANIGIEHSAIAMRNDIREFENEVTINRRGATFSYNRR